MAGVGSEYVHIEGAWQAAVASRRRRISAEHQLLGERWQHAFASMVRQTDELRAQGRWVLGRRDLLGVLERDRDELVHSTVLAWLLTPSAGHGLGATVLRALFDAVGLAEPADAELGGAVVRREVVHPDGRADLVVEMPSHRVVIENKIDALEQPHQCARMVAAFDRAGAAFVFLTLDGHAPTTAGDTLDRWTSISHRQVANWLEQATEPSKYDDHAGVRAYLATLKELTP